MFRFILVLALVFSANVSSGRHLQKKSHRKLSDRIVGGEETTIEKRPYQVAITLTDTSGQSYMCGGSILNKRFILTAAHCVEDIVEAEVRVGSANYWDGKPYKTKKMMQHPRYNSNTQDYDAAIIDLNSEVIDLNGNTAEAVKLIAPRTVIPAGTVVTVSGWGATSEGGPVSNVLREVNVNIFNKQNCTAGYRYYTDRMICAGFSEGGKDSCQGDSGGPLVLANNNTQVGIVSFGYGCAQAGHPGYYSRVAVLRGWIKTVSGV